MQTFETTIKINPEPWRRTARGQYGQAYIRTKDARYRGELTRLLRRAKPAGWKTLEKTPVFLSVDFDYDEQTIRIQFGELGFTARKNFKRPDLDNLIKNIAECLEGAGFIKDDAQISELFARKSGKRRIGKRRVGTKTKKTKGGTNLVSNTVSKNRARRGNGSRRDPRPRVRKTKSDASRRSRNRVS